MNMETAIAALEHVFGRFELEHGVPPAEIDAAERRLGFALPAALRTLYERTGRHPFHTAQDELVPPSRLGLDDDHLVIYEENQRVCSWGIGKAALPTDDPPVDTNVMTERGIEYISEFVSVTHFLVSQAALQAVATLPFSGLILPPSQIAGRQVAEPSRSVSREQGRIIGEVLWTTSDADVRSRDGAIAFVASNGYFSLAARDEATFRAISRALDVHDDDWDYFSPHDS